MKPIKLAAIASIILLVSSAQAFAKGLTIADVVSLSKIGLGDDAIIAKINSEHSQFDLSTDQMIELKKEGVSSPVIAAMLNSHPVTKQEMSLDSPDPMVPHPQGMYVLLDSGADAKMQQMQPTVSSQAKTGGIFGYALTGGIASASIKVAIQNETALTKTSGSPKFFFFFGEANNPSGSGTWSSGANAIVTSPSEFTLVKLKKKKGRREARVGSMNIAGAKTGVMDKDRIPFDYTMVRQGVFEVQPRASLEPGEYGFIFPLIGGGTAGATTARIFDFSVQGN